MYDEKLFSTTDLSGVLRTLVQHVLKDISGLSETRLQGTSDEALVAYFIERCTFDPLVLYPDRTSSSLKEISVTVSATESDRFMYDLQPGTPKEVPCVEITVEIPFSGSVSLLKCQPSSFGGSTITANITDPGADGVGKLQTKFTYPKKDATKDGIQKDIDNWVQRIQGMARRQEEEIKRFNEPLPNMFSDALLKRRTELGAVLALAKALNIPIAPRPGMPPLQPISVRMKGAPTLPPIVNERQAAGFAIDADAYKHILSALRAQGRTFEKSPTTFNKFEEEELRDVILANLNTHFNGQATGETFRGAGKSDICIEQDNRAAFVAELKVWHGVSELKKALDQLLGYLTWRDCKTALVMFNKDRSKFSELLTKVPDALRAHPLFSSEESVVEPGEWHFRFRSPNDEGRIVQVRVFLYDIYVSKV